MGRHSSGGTGTVPLPICSQCPGSLLLSLWIKQLLGGEGEGGEGTALDHHQTPWAHLGARESFPTLPSQSTQMPSVASKDQATGGRLGQHSVLGLRSDLGDLVFWRQDLAVWCRGECSADMRGASDTLQLPSVPSRPPGCSWR